MQCLGLSLGTIALLPIELLHFCDIEKGIILSSKSIKQMLMVDFLLFADKNQHYQFFVNHHYLNWNCGYFSIYVTVMHVYPTDETRKN